MRRIVLTLALALGCVTAATAHFVFVVPEADGKGVKVVFSDSLAPDEAVDIGKIARTTLTARDAAGKSTPVKLTKAEHAYTVKLGSPAVVIEGTTEYGVLAKGGAKPFQLRYHPRAVLDLAAFTPDRDKPATFEVVPSMQGGGVRFQVLAAGKPVADNEVNLMLPGDEKKKVKTDKDGYTESFKAKGRYGLWTRHSEGKAGEAGGKKFDEVRHYATLVVDVK
jgi:uncharacterized GH25 family protein